MGRNSSVDEGGGTTVVNDADRPRLPSIRDVARLAAVSHQTVSRVLNEHPSIRDETKQRVLNAIAELDYRPNQAARALASSRVNRIGVLSATIGEFGPTSSIAAIEEAARVEGFSVTTLNLPDTSPDAIERAAKQLLHEQVDGIVVIAPQLRVFHVLRDIAIGVPFVSLQESSKRLGPAIAEAQFEGARLATQHLIDLGHRDIVHIAGPQDWIEADSRMRGYLEALSAADIAPHPPIRADWSANFGFFAGQELARTQSFTAVFAANDLLAIGFMHGMRDAGIDVPRDVSVVGFDDVPVSAHVWPPLTTVHIDFSDLGRRAIARLLELVDGRDSGLTHLAVPELIVRGSTAAPHVNL